MHSEVSQRRGDKANRHHRNNNNNNNDYGNSPMQSPANENGPNGSRLGQRKGNLSEQVSSLRRKRVKFVYL